VRSGVRDGGFASPLASAQGYAAQWLMRVTQARAHPQLLGNVLVRQGSRFDTFRLAHMFETTRSPKSS
jgi:hypothetical protein